MKNILICSDSFKGTLSSKDISNICKETVSFLFPNQFCIDSLLIADGGEGTLDAFSNILKGKFITIKSVDAENNNIDVNVYVTNNNEAIIEVANIIGLPMIKKNISPLNRTTKGIGIVIKDLIKRNIKTFYIGLGGTSTSDMGIGMLQELGVDFGVNDPLTMNNASLINKIDVSKSILNNKDINIVCLSDVINPLFGDKGANKVFGPQKGFNEDDIKILEDNFIHISNLIKRDLNVDLNNVSSLGAAGGLSSAFYAFSNCKIKSGIDELLRLSNFKEKVKNVDYVISGEGRFDEQSLNGKVISGILKNIDKNKLIIICGKSKIKDNIGIKIYQTSKDSMPYTFIKENAKRLYMETLINVLNDIKD